MGDNKPGRYWDHNECRWVKCPSPASDEVAVPDQATAAEDLEVDVRSG